MLELSWLLACLALCLALTHTLQRSVYKVLRYRSIRPVHSLLDIVNLLRTSSCQLELEAEARCQISKERDLDSERLMSSRHDFLRDDVRRRTELDSLAEALGDSTFFKILDQEPLAALAEALQADGLQQKGGRMLRCDCFYQSEAGLQRLFVLSDPETKVTLSLQRANDAASSTKYHTAESRLLYSPSSLACALLPQPAQLSQCTAQAFECSLHARLPPTGFWSISFASLVDCLAAWPEARRRLLLQFWSHINDTLLLVLVEWLGLDACRFFDDKEYQDLLASEMERLAEEVAATTGANIADKSFYERKSLYRRLAVRLLQEISGEKTAPSDLESHVTIKYCSSLPGGDAPDGRRAFLVLEGRIETTSSRVTEGVGSSCSDSSSLLPGWVGLVPYFAHSPLPFQVRAETGLSESASAFETKPVSCSNGAIVAEFSDAFMDEIFRSPDTADATTEKATGFLLRQLTRQVFLYDLLINHRRLHRGERLVRRGDPSETVEIIVSGRLQRGGSAHLSRGDCVGLIEGLLDSSAAEAHNWTVDVVALRESRVVSLPLSLAQAWVSPARRLHILDRLLRRLCEARLDRQQLQLQRLWRHQQLRTTLRARGGSCFEAEVADDSSNDLDEEDEKVGSQGTAWLTRQRQHRRSRLIGFEIDPTRFNQRAVQDHIQLCLAAAHGAASARVVSEADAERHFGRPADQLPEAALRNWLEDQELACSVLVLVSSGRVTRWTRLLLGFLDCLVVCCDSDVKDAQLSGELPSNAEEFYSQMHRSRVHLAVFHPLTLGPVPEGTSLRFLRHRRWWARRVFHVRCSTGRYKFSSAAQTLPSPPASAGFESDLARLTRCVSGAGVGIAFGNAAPRGLANIGALEALLAGDVAIDMVAGSGLGALTAAAWALHAGDLSATRKSLKRHWSRIGSRWSRLCDLTLPLVSTYTGAELNASLRRMLGDRRQVEDLWLPFVAVSTDLVAAQAVAHTTGTLWRSVRASCGQVGVYPPVWEPRTGRLLLDGAHTDRLPARTLRCRLQARWVVAAALESKRRIRLGTYLVFGDYVSGFAELARSFNPFRLTPLAPAGADIQDALASLASGELSHGGGRNGDDDEDDEDDADDDDDGDVRLGDSDGPTSSAHFNYCVTVRPDPSFSPADVSNQRLGEAERWRGYWATRRRLRRLEAASLNALRGCAGLRTMELGAV